MLLSLARLAAARRAAAGGALLLRRGAGAFVSANTPSSSLAARPLSSSASPRANAGKEELDELDRIHMRGMTFHGYHGVFPEENALGQKFVADVTIYMDLRPAGKSDDLKDTLDYAAAYAAVRRVVEGPDGRGPARPAPPPASRRAATAPGPFALVERVAQRCAEALLAMDARVRAVRVGVRKPHVAVEGVLESLGVEVLRRRQAAGGGAAR